jgi:hypothetical protein
VLPCCFFATSTAIATGIPGASPEQLWPRPVWRPGWQQQPGSDHNRKLRRVKCVKKIRESSVPNASASALLTCRAKSQNSVRTHVSGVMMQNAELRQTGMKNS